MEQIRENSLKPWFLDISGQKRAKTGPKWAKPHFSTTKNHLRNLILLIFWLFAKNQNISTDQIQENSLKPGFLDLSGQKLAKTGPKWAKPDFSTTYNQLHNLILLIF